MTVLERIAAALRELIERGGPAGVREPRRPAPKAPEGEANMTWGAAQPIWNWVTREQVEVLGASRARDSFDEGTGAPEPDAEWIDLSDLGEAFKSRTL